MRRLFLVGSGPSLRAVSPEERCWLAYHPTMATSSFVLWPDAWEPTFYLVNDAQDADPEPAAYCNLVEKRWPDCHKLIETTLTEYRPRLGWTWFERNLDKNLQFYRQKSFAYRQLATAPVVANCHNPLWYAVQIAVLLGYDDLVLLGAEHTEAGYAHDPAMPHVRDLIQSRAEALTLLEECAIKNVRLRDASGPTSTLQLSKVSLKEMIACADS